MVGDRKVNEFEIKIMNFFLLSAQREQGPRCSTWQCELWDFVITDLQKWDLKLDFIY